MYMKQLGKDILASVMVGVLLPAMILNYGAKVQRQALRKNLEIETAEHTVLPVKVRDKQGYVTEQNMDDYLVGVVLAEMPASFEPEALKAQACAARTYTVRLQSRGGKHDNADVCTDSKCCQAYISPADAELKWGVQVEEFSAKIARAVADTDGLGVLYAGEPIEAVFFSSAPGKTTDAVAVWGNSVDYLKSVDSPEGDEVPNYRTEVVLAAEEVRTRILTAYPGADLSGNPGSWFSQIHTGESGAVTSLLVGGVTLTGNQLRGALGLRSPAFTIRYDGADFVFSVTGYGHGVGMSQYGANKMAAEGADFRAILEWYYTGAQVGRLW
jgi:stage II sporulation protein D